MKRKSAIAIICVLAVLLLAAPLSYAWFSYSLKSEAHMDSYVHKSYFESGDGTGATQFAGSGLSSEEGCAFEIKYPVQLYYFAWLQALGYFNIPQNGSEIEQVYFYLSDDLDMTGWVLPQVGTQTYPFVGNFNGNGHTISNLTVQNVEGTGPNAWTDKPDDITGLNIVGFFGVVGSLNPTGSANAGEVNAAVSSGSSFTPTAGYTYDNAVNEIKNFILEDTVIKTDLANSLAGIAAGYVNGTMENVKVVGGTLHSTATTALTYTANLSDYGAVGYCTADYRGTNSVVTVYVYDPQVYTNANGSAMEQGNNWGNSVEIQTMYEDLNAVYSGSGSAITYANSVTVTHHADGTVTEVLSNDGTTVNLTVQTYPVHVTEVDDDGNVIASYALIEQNATSDFVYLYGEHLADTVTQQVTDVYEKDSYYIYHDDGTTAHNLAFSGTAFSDEARANATKWVIEDSGTDTKVIYTIIGNNKYYLKNDAGALAYTGAGVTAAVPADATEWTVTDTTISNDGRFLCYRNGVWKLMLQDRLLITDDNEVGAQHFLTVVSGAYANTMVKADAVSWTKTMASDNPDETEFYLSTTVGANTYYLKQVNGELALETNPVTPTTKWKYKAATETEKSKVYTVINEDGDGYALYYDDADDVLNWSLTDFSEHAAGSGEGHSFGNTIDMSKMFTQLKNLRDSYTTATYTASKRIIIDESDHDNDRETVLSTGTLPNGSGSGWNAQIKTYHFDPYGEVTMTARAIQSSNEYLYLTDTSDTNPTNVVKIVYKTETEDAFYISASETYLNVTANGSGITTAANDGNNTKWRLTNVNEGYIRTEIYGVWYYLVINDSNTLAVSASPSTVWTDHGDGRISGSRGGIDWYLNYDNGWSLYPGAKSYTISNGTYYLNRQSNTAVTYGSAANSATAWTFENIDGTGYIALAYNNSLYYLYVNNGAVALTNNAAGATDWTHSGNRITCMVNGQTWYLRCKGTSWEIYPAAGTYNISYGGNYLSNTGTTVDNETTAAAATDWVWDETNGRIYTGYNGSVYYLNVSSGALTLTTSVPSITWTYADGAYSYSDAQGRTWYLRWNGSNWDVFPARTSYTIRSGSDYFGVSANDLSLTNAAGAAHWITDGNKLYTPVGGTYYYLVGSTDGSGDLSLSTNRSNGTDWTYTLAGGAMSYTGNEKTWYLYKENGDWAVYPSASINTISQNGQYLRASSATAVDGTTAANASVWMTDGSGHIYTFYNGANRYLTSNGTGVTLADSPSTVWTRNGDNTVTNGDGWYLVYDNGWKAYPSLNYILIKDGDHYLTRSGNGVTDGGSASASRWFTDGLKLYTPDGAAKYYLSATGSGLSVTTTAADGTAFVYDGTNKRLSFTDGSTYYVVYNNGWTVNTSYVKGVYITTTSGGNTYYLNTDGSVVSTGTNQGAATLWTYNGTSGTVSTVIGNTPYYLRAALETNNRRNSTNLTVTQTAGSATTFTMNNGNLTCSLSPHGTATTYRLALDNGALKMVNTGHTYYTISSGSHYFGLNGTSVQDQTETTATLWDFSDTGNNVSTQVYTLVNGTTYYYLRLNNNNIITNSETTVTYNNGAFTYNSGIRNYCLDYNNGWTRTRYYFTATTLTRQPVTFTAAAISLVEVPFTTEEESVTITAATTYNSRSALNNVVFTSVTENTAVSRTAQDYAQLTVGEKQSYSVTKTPTAAQLFERTEYQEPVGETYYPLAVSATENNANPYEVSKENTGYVLSGTSDSAGDIRVSQYTKSDITNSVTNTNNNGQLTWTQSGKNLYTRNASGVVSLTTDYINNNFHKFSDVTVGGETIKGSFTNFNEILNGTQNVYGLHFMNASIGTNNLATLPHAKILGHNYENYQMPKDSIDFRLKERGYINFFAGTYYTNNNCFFSLHKIERYHEEDEDVLAGTANVNEIKSIKKVLEIYGNGNENDPYVYKLYDGTNTTYESWTFYPSGRIKTHTTYQGPPSGYSSLFDTTWITNNNINYSSSYANRVFYFEIPVDQGEYALGSVDGGTGAYLMYLDIGTSGTALKPEGNAKLEETTFNDLNALHSDAGLISYTVTGGTRPVNVETYPTYFPLAWEAENGVRTGSVASTNTGYVVSGANTNSRPPGDIRVSRYVKYASGDWASIRESLTSPNNAGILDDTKVYTIIDGVQRNIADYGIGKLHTMQYGSVSKTVNELLRNNQYVYGLHFMQSAISASSTVTVPKAVINGVTKTNYVMPQDSIDFNVATKGRIAFMAGTYFSGSSGTQSFFSLHRVFRDGSDNITDIKQLSEIYSDGSPEHGYVYRYKNDANYYKYDPGTGLFETSAALPANYVKVYDLQAIDDPSAYGGISTLTQNSVYYFEIPVDAGEYALGSSNSDGAYLIYLDIAANADFSLQTVVTEVTVQEESENAFPKGVAFVDAADSVAFNTAGVADPEKSVFLSIPMANSSDDTTFAITSGAAMTVANGTSTLAGYTVQSIPIGGSLTVNGVAAARTFTRTIVTEKVTAIELDVGGTTTTTVTETVKTTVGVGAPTYYVTQTVTTEFNGVTSSPTVTHPAYDGHTIEIPDDLTSQTVPKAKASEILRIAYVAAGVTADLTRVGMPNLEETEYTLTVSGDASIPDGEYPIYDAVPDSAAVPAVPAATYNVTLSGTAGTYTVIVIAADDDFVFNVGGGPVSAGDSVTVTVAAAP
ncbi:MAG: hypothetical protein IJQ53_03330 [Clostridia bacterium]|nr:hypothetical protein [Clostridia bacterium]